MYFKIWKINYYRTCVTMKLAGKYDLLPRTQILETLDAL